jgi:hypothetical protein
MAQHSYTIRKALLLPLGVDVVLLFCLLAMAVVLKGEAVETLVLALFFLPALIVFLECLRRQVSVAEQGLAVRKLWRKREVSWDEITHLGCLALHRKVYLLLTTVKGFLIISSAFERFPALAEEIVAHVDAERVEEEVRVQAGRAVTMMPAIASAWVAAVAMMGIICVKLFPFTH